MSAAQWTLAAILVVTLVLFVWGRWRYDVVALLTLFASVMAGLVAPEQAFLGFGHPATVTVAAVLVLSRALTVSGAIDGIARVVQPTARQASLHIGVLSGVGAALSGFMNNVGALALLMPVATETAAGAKRSPRAVLMPLAFATLLGGLITVIGTPPNILIALFREERFGQAFGMFDFTPVGGLVAVAGILFIALAGWRLIPRVRETAGTAQELFEIEPYLIEVQVGNDSKAVGKPFEEIDAAIGDLDVAVVGLIRRGRRHPVPPKTEPMAPGDVLILEAEPGDLDKFVAVFKFEIPGAPETQEKKKEGKKDKDDGDAKKLLDPDDKTIAEVVIRTGSRLEGRTVEQVGFATRYGVTLLGVSRQGRSHRGRLRQFRFQVGDVLLLHGHAEELPEVAGRLGCLPLAQRDVAFGKRHQALPAITIFGAAVAAAALGLVPLPVAFGIAVLAVVLANILPVRQLYEDIDWPVIVLLGALIPVGGAMTTTGMARVVAEALSTVLAGAPVFAVLALLMLVTAALSNVLNNAATAVVMAPIAVDMAAHLDANPDPFLMAVAVAASCAFLTPIGHQNNALVMGPGGYAFGDYWPLGLPLTAGVIALAVPAILFFWPP